MSERKQATPPRVLARTLYAARLSYAGQKLKAAVEALPTRKDIPGISKEAKSWMANLAVEQILRYHEVCKEIDDAPRWSAAVYSKLQSSQRVSKASAQKTIDQFAGAAKRLKKSLTPCLLT